MEADAAEQFNSTSTVNPLMEPAVEVVSDTDGANRDEPCDEKQVKKLSFQDPLLRCPTQDVRHIG